MRLQSRLLRLSGLLAVAVVLGDADKVENGLAALTAVERGGQ